MKQLTSIIFVLISLISYAQDISCREIIAPKAGTSIAANAELEIRVYVENLGSITYNSSDTLEVTVAVEQSGSVLPGGAIYHITAGSFAPGDTQELKLDHFIDGSDTTDLRLIDLAPDVLTGTCSILVHLEMGMSSIDSLSSNNTCESSITVGSITGLTALSPKPQIIISNGKLIIEQMDDYFDSQIQIKIFNLVGGLAYSVSNVDPGQGYVDLPHNKKGIYLIVLEDRSGKRLYTEIIS